MKPTLRVLSTVLLAGACLSAQAAPGAPELRHFELSVTSPTAAQSSVGRDNFNNGNPYTGITYTRPGQADTAGTYQSSSFTSGAERTGAASDFAGTQFGVGGLSFRRGDAVDSTTNLTPAGTTSSSVVLRTAVVPGTALGLANQSSGFSITTVWNYATLLRGESVSLVLSGTNGTNYTDRINLSMRNNYTTGLTSFAFEQQSSVGGVISRNLLGSVDPGAVFADLASVDYFALTLDRDIPSAGVTNPGVHATITFFDAAVDASGDLVQLGRYTFAAEGFSFGTGTSGFAGMFAAASWIDPITSTTPVPEPGSWALMSLGLVALGAAARRRKPA